MKFNTVLLLKILLAEAFYFLVMYVVLLFGFFLYFGSGAGASGAAAESAAKISVLVIVLVPLIFNSYKSVELKPTKRRDAASFTLSSIVVLFLGFALLVSTDWLGN